MRITEKMLQLLCTQINKEAGAPLDYCDKSLPCPRPFNIGHYYIDMAYGGYKLVQLTNKHGGIHEVTYGFTTKRELFDKMQAYLSGLQARVK